MRYKILCLLIAFSLFSCKNDPIEQPEIVDYDYESWPGKSGLIKTNIEFPDHLISEYGLSLNLNSSGNSLFYSLPLNKNDGYKGGNLEVKVFLSVEEAQLALVNYLDYYESSIKPPRLTNGDFNVGDVAFGWINGEIIFLEFVRNNVLVIVHAPKEMTKIIVKEIDEKIQLAPEWQTGASVPSFILNE